MKSSIFALLIINSFNVTGIFCHKVTRTDGIELVVESGQVASSLRKKGSTNNIHTKGKDAAEHIRQLVELIDFGGDPAADLFPLQECQGDCDSDSDCDVGLYCLQRDVDDGEDVPGCTGRSMSQTDFCVRATPPPEPTISDTTPSMNTALDRLQLAGDLTTAQVQSIIAACVEKATEIDTPMNIAVVDAGTNLKGFLRMDGAWLGSIDIAQKKARTTRFFNLDTRDIGPLTQPGQPLYGIEHSNDGLITFGGGVLIRDNNGVVIGGIGVSGGSVEQDHEVAAAGLEGL